MSSSRFPEEEGTHRCPPPRQLPREEKEGRVIRQTCFRSQHVTPLMRLPVRASPVNTRDITHAAPGAGSAEDGKMAPPHANAPSPVGGGVETAPSPGELSHHAPVLHDGSSGAASCTSGFRRSVRCVTTLRPPSQVEGPARGRRSGWIQERPEGDAETSEFHLVSYRKSVLIMSAPARSRNRGRQRETEVKDEPWRFCVM